MVRLIFCGMTFTYIYVYICTHGERSFVVHLSHRHISSSRVHHEHLLIVAQLELRVERVNHRNRPVGLLEGNRHQKPVGKKFCSSSLCSKSL